MKNNDINWIQKQQRGPKKREDDVYVGICKNGSLYISFSAQGWFYLGKPAYLLVGHAANRIYFRPTSDDSGYMLSKNKKGNGMRVQVSSSFINPYYPIGSIPGCYDLDLDHECGWAFIDLEKKTNVTA